MMLIRKWLTFMKKYEKKEEENLKIKRNIYL
jgi:hypothetical protein